MRTGNSEHAQRRKRLLAVARLLTTALVALTILLFAVGLVIGLGSLQEVCTGDSCHPAQLSPAEAALNAQLGLTLNFYAWFTVVSFALFGGGFFAVSVLILRQRSDEPMALYIALFLTMVGGGANPVIPVLGSAVFAFFGLMIFPLFALFPDGRFVPRWIRWLVLPWILYAIVQFIGSPPARGISSGPPGLLTQVAFLVGIGAQFYRYRRVSGPLQRQQTKWVLLGFAAWILGLFALLIVRVLVPALTDGGRADFFFDRYVFAIVGLGPILGIPLGFGVAILRFRLWDIDILIRRTLIYTVLTGALALLYYIGVVFLQSILAAVTGHEANTLAVVLTTLAVAALFSPLRRRIQSRIDRRFYRRKYDAAQTLARFAIRARDEVELEMLVVELAETVQETFQPQHLQLWLKDR